MAQQTGAEPVEPIADETRSSTEAWVLLDERTPDRSVGDTTKAARIAAAILVDARSLRARFGDRMLAVDAEPEAVRLHELLHATERSALAAQRHGVESLTARLRNDDNALRGIAEQTFVRVDEAATSLREAFHFAEALGGHAEPSGPTVADGDQFQEIRTVSRTDDLGMAARSSRAERMRQDKPKPEHLTPESATSSDDLAGYSSGSEPWPRWPVDDQTDESSGFDSNDPPAGNEPVDLVAEPVASSAELVVIGDGKSAARPPITPGQMRLYRVLVVVLVVLIVFGLWLLLSDNSFIG